MCFIINIIFFLPYRLHQTEVKSKVHGCITSSKFLVAEGYRVKVVNAKSGLSYACVSVWSVVLQGLLFFLTFLTMEYKCECLID